MAGRGRLLYANTCTSIDVDRRGDAGGPGLGCHLAFWIDKPIATKAVVTAHAQRAAALRSQAVIAAASVHVALSRTVI